MDEEKKPELLELDTEMDLEQKTKRSSILKPRKSRNPLSTLDFSEANLDNSAIKASRRVSFASSNFVKPFTADPVENTIWDNTYEEQVDQTDSTKSSCDQTNGPKTNDLLNMTSICTEIPDLYEAKESLITEHVNINIERVQTVSTTESLVSLARKLRSRSKSEQATSEEMDLTVTNKTNITKNIQRFDAFNKENISVVSSFNRTDNISCSTTKLTENMEFTGCITDKENVNPIINDLSIVLPKVCSNMFNTTQYFPGADLDFTEGVETNRKCEQNRVCDLNNSAVTMDFTCFSSGNNQELNQIDDVHMKTINTDNFLSGEFEIVHENGPIEVNARRRTILFDESDAKMDLTLNDQTEYNSGLKNQVVLPDASDLDMEFTKSLPVKILSNILIREATVPVQNARPFARTNETVYFESGQEMEFTGTFAMRKNVEETICMENLECDAQVNVESMELTSLINDNVEEVGKGGINAECHMEITSTLHKSDMTKFKQCDMSLKQNLQTANTDLKNHVSLKNVDAKTESELKINSRRAKQDNFITETTENQNFQNPVVNLCKPSDVTSNSSTNLKDTEVQDDSRTFTSKNALPAGNLDDSNNDRECQSVKTDISASNVTKGFTDSKRHLTQCSNEDPIKKRKIGDAFAKCETTESEKPLPNEVVHSNMETETLHDIPAATVTGEGLPAATGFESNILYSEPMKRRLKTSRFAPISDLSAQMDFDGTLNPNHITPATSFHMNFSTTSSCTEDTQQLIHATFSKPETLKVLRDAKNNDSNRSSNCFKDIKLGNVSFVNDSNTENTCFPHPELEVSAKEHEKFLRMSDAVAEDSKNYLLKDITPVELAESDSSNSPERRDIKATDEVKSLWNNSSFGDIEDRLLIYEPVRREPNSLLLQSVKESTENCNIIKELCKLKINIVDLEEKHRRDLEESLSTASDSAVSGGDVDSESLLPLELIAPKTLEERVREIGEGTKGYWEFVKAKDDCYYFYTLFGTLPFKVHIHPELGIVFGVETYKNLSDISQPLCMYQLNVLEKKLAQDNLLSVLGNRFDVFTLLDYVYISMEEIINFHVEYMSLVKKYGKSHHFRMNPDHSITFEIINVKWIILWIITVRMPPAGPLSVTKEDVSAAYKVGQKVNEEHIRTVAENSPRGNGFLRKFIENIDDYVNRIYSKRMRK